MRLAAMIVFGLVGIQNGAPAVPARGNDPDYPLRVQVAQLGSSARGLFGSSGYGHGNVLGPPTEGFDYTEDCNERFASRPEGDQYFRARWKKLGQKLEVLIQEMGSDRILRCELKVAMRDEAYDLNPTRGVKLFPLVPSRPAVPVTEPDPNFPLRLELWVRSFGMSSQTGSNAEGYGNVVGPPAEGFDWANQCPVRLPRGRGGPEVYQARWVEKGLQLEILLQEVGSRQQHTCLLDVGMRSAPYPATVPGVRSPVPPPAETIRSPRGAQAPSSNSDGPRP